LQNLPTGAKVEVFNLNGKLISSKSLNQVNHGSDNFGVQTISVHTKGMYIVKISSVSIKQMLRVAVR
jgi:hypothetical protein